MRQNRRLLQEGAHPPLILFSAPQGALDLSKVCFFTLRDMAPGSSIASGGISCRGRLGASHFCGSGGRFATVAPHEGDQSPSCTPPALRGDSIYRYASEKCRRWSMDKQNAQRHLSLRDSLGLSPTGNIMGPPGRRQPARRLANVSAAPGGKDYAAPTRRGPRTSK